MMVFKMRGQENMTHAKTSRRHDREPVDFQVVLYWEDVAGQVDSTRARACDLSPAGMRLQSEVGLEPGTHVYLDVRRSDVPVEGAIRYCMRAEGGYRIGVEFSNYAGRAAESFARDVDYYEILQLSPRADIETIHRV